MTVGSGVIAGVSVAHGRASVDEIAAAGYDDQRSGVVALLAEPGVSEAYVLQTCNRAEAYVVATDPACARTALSGFAPSVRDDAVVELDHEESLRHLMRVAAGLESLVLGEDQILGQVRTAYETARGADAIGPMLEDGITKALHVGERVRTETAINEGVVSMGSAAAELLAEDVDLDGATALVVGAGEMGTLSARALAARDVDELLVANRTLPHAEHVADTVDAPAEALTLSALPVVVERADAVVTATASDDPLLEADALADGEHVVVDLGQPRDVAPGATERASVTVYDLDDLESVTETTRRRRQAAADAAETIVDAEFDRLLDQYKRKRADDVIGAMYESAERIKAQEVSTAISKLEGEDGLTDGQREIVESLADALVSQLLAAPTKSLREAAAEDDWTTIDTALQLFDPEFGDGDASSFVADPDRPPSTDGPEGLPPEVAENLPTEVVEQLPDDVPADGPPERFRRDD